jgi:ParB/RepB/Spo0J family partition protein
MQDALQVLMIELERIVPSATQPRKHFDPEKQTELENSMRAHGFTMSALLVRPKGNGSNGTDGTYELVAGERRWRAAKAVGVARCPAIVRELTDAEVLVLQLVENLQRDDLTPMEEAEGYQQVLALRDEAGNPVHTVQTLAREIGKSPDVIWRLRKLCVLAGEARTAVEKGVLPPRTALLIARLPEEALRNKAAKAILHPQYEEAPLSFRKAEELVRRDFMRDLQDAPFDQADATLVPIETDATGDRVAGGACTDCPLRSQSEGRGNHPMCLNPTCYERKKSAEWEAWQAKESSVDGKRKALSEKDCLQIYSFANQLSYSCGLVDLSQHPDGGDLKPGEESPGTWRQLTKGAELEVIVARDRNGKKHELVRRDLAMIAAAGAGHKVFKSAAPREKQVSDDEAKALAEKRARDQAADEAVIKGLLGALAEKAQVMKQLPRVFLEEAVLWLFEGEVGLLAWERRGHTESGPGCIERVLKKMEDRKLVGFFVEVFSENWIDPYTNERTQSFDRMLKGFGVDRKAVEKKARTEHAAAIAPPKVEPDLRKLCSQCSAAAEPGKSMCDHCLGLVRERARKRRAAEKKGGAK